MNADLDGIYGDDEVEAVPEIIPMSIFAFRAGRPGESLNHSHLAISSLGQTLTFTVDPVGGTLEEVSWGSIQQLKL